MKKTILLSILLCAIPVVGSMVGARHTAGGEPTAGIQFASQFLPKLDFDFSDLDARDAQNRPISTPLAAQQLASLFRDNLVEFTVAAAPHAIRQAIRILDEFSHLFNKLILKKIPALFQWFLEAIIPPERRFVHNVHNLWTMFSVGILAASLVLLRFCDDRSPQRINLRC